MNVGSGNGPPELDDGDGCGDGRALDVVVAGAGAVVRGAACAAGDVVDGVGAGECRSSERAARASVALACAADSVAWCVATAEGPPAPSWRRCAGTLITRTAITPARANTPTRPATASVVGDSRTPSSRLRGCACRPRGEDAMWQLSHLP